MAETNLPINGHFVPEFFLRRFRALGGSLWVYFHGDGWTRREGSDMPAKQDFYSPWLQDAYRRIETSAADILDKTVYDRKPPAGESRETLAYCLGLLHSRTPAFYENLPHPLSGTMNKVSSLYQRYYADNPAELEKLKRDMAASGNPLPAWFKAEHLNPDQTNLDSVSGTGAEAAETTAAVLNAMTWSFLTTSEEAPFVTSDNPFVYANNQDGDPSGAGLLYAHTEVTVPLSSTVALSAAWPNPHENIFLAVDESTVEQVNLRMIAASNKFIAASKQDFPGAKHLETMVRPT